MDLQPTHNLSNQLASDSVATISLMGARWILWIFLLASTSYLREAASVHSSAGLTVESANIGSRACKEAAKVDKT
ncbi:hypothetical protein M5689_020244 [Euphorbia peplus]|nr:hypothetical protein M5689_020244 [Euphorbia peplus]